MASELRVDRIIPVNGVPTGGGGGIIQVVPFFSTSGTDVTTTSETNIEASKVSITTMGTNSLILYYASFSTESDLLASSNGFLSLKYSQNNWSSSTHVYTDKRLNTTQIQDSQGSALHTVTMYHKSTWAAATTVSYGISFQKSSSSSIYFNQQSLSGQPSGTSNMAMGWIMEVSA